MVDNKNVLFQWNAYCLWVKPRMVVSEHCLTRNRFGRPKAETRPCNAAPLPVVLPFPFADSVFCPCRMPITAFFFHGHRHYFSVKSNPFSDDGLWESLAHVNTKRVHFRMLPGQWIWRRTDATWRGWRLIQNQTRGLFVISIDRMERFAWGCKETVILWKAIFF